MSMSNVDKYISPGLCRCCGELTVHRILNAPYNMMGKTEIYEDMIDYCFGIKFSGLDSPGNVQNKVICGLCVLKVRDSWNFKKQVELCEEKFLQKGGLKVPVVNKPHSLTISEACKECQLRQTRVDEETSRWRTELEEHKRRYNLDGFDTELNEEQLAEYNELGKYIFCEDFNETDAEMVQEQAYEHKNSGQTSKNPAQDSKKPAQTSKNPVKTSKNPVQTSIKTIKPAQTSIKPTLIAAKKRSGIIKMMINKQNSAEPLLKDLKVVLPRLMPKPDSAPQLHRLQSPENNTVTQYVLSPKETKTRPNIIPSQRPANSIIAEYNIINPTEIKRKPNILRGKKSKNGKFIKCMAPGCITRVLNMETGNIGVPLRWKCNDHLNWQPVLQARKPKTPKSNVLERKDVSETSNVPNSIPVIKISDFAENEKVDKIEILPDTEEVEYLDDAEVEDNQDNDSESESDFDEDENIQKRNSTFLIKNSYACPFQRTAVRVRCYYCSKYYPEYELLRKHTLEHSTDEFQHNGDKFIRVDITRIDCRRCPANINSLLELAHHLHSEHNKRNIALANSGLIPYELARGGLQCVVCDVKFTSFLDLDEHMMDHFSKHVCDACGDVFMDDASLQAHVAAIEASEAACAVCHKHFDNATRRRQHMKDHDEAAISDWSAENGLHDSDSPYAPSDEELDRRKRSKPKKKAKIQEKPSTTTQYSDLDDDDGLKDIWDEHFKDTEQENNGQDNVDNIGQNGETTGQNVEENKTSENNITDQAQKRTVEDTFQNEVPRKRGRPKKEKPTNEVRKRGRPRKNVKENNGQDNVDNGRNGETSQNVEENKTSENNMTDQAQKRTLEDTSPNEVPKKRGRGRPKKEKPTNEVRKRGRPRKNFNYYLSAAIKNTFQYQIKKSSKTNRGKYIPVHSTPSFDNIKISQFAEISRNIQKTDDEDTKSNKDTIIHDTESAQDKDFDEDTKPNNDIIIHDTESEQDTDSDEDTQPNKDTIIHDTESEQDTDSDEDTQPNKDTIIHDTESEQDTDSDEDTQPTKDTIIHDTESEQDTDSDEDTQPNKDTIIHDTESEQDTDSDEDIQPNKDTIIHESDQDTTKRNTDSDEDTLTHKIEYIIESDDAESTHSTFETSVKQIDISTHENVTVVSNSDFEFFEYIE